MTTPTDQKPTKGAKGEPSRKFKVQGPAHGRWRLGRQFGPVPQEVELTEAEFNVIQEDPLLKILS